jgi:hypothetical protein
LGKLRSGHLTRERSAISPLWSSFPQSPTQLEFAGQFAPFWHKAKSTTVSRG